MHLSEEQMSQTATVYDAYTDEYIGVVHTAITNEADVLDEDHFYLVLKA